MQPVLSMSMWVSLSTEQRQRIRALFSIPKSRSTEVNDGQIISDGTTSEDFKHLTIEKMQKYLVDESNDFHKLFDKVVARVQDEIEGKPIVSQVTEVTLATPAVPVVKKRGRPAKSNV